MSNVHYVELCYTQQIFSQKDVCSAGDLIFLKLNVGVYMHVQVKVVISRVQPVITSMHFGLNYSEPSAVTNFA